jgi:hypothetical protein
VVDVKVCWISAGVSSFVAGYLCKDEIDKFIYIDIEDQEKDTMRFIKDCEKALGKDIEILKSEYGCVENAILSAGVIKLQGGFAPCTNWLKKRVRKQWEDEHRNEDITYFWGMDVNEVNRAERLKESMPQFEHRFPLIENHMTKESSHGLLQELGIKRPRMYDLGYPNNNCVGCIKGGMGYWNKIRKDFPEVFEKRSKMEQKIGHSILKECYLADLDENRGNNKEIFPECDIFCMIQRR